VREFNQQGIKLLKVALNVWSYNISWNTAKYAIKTTKYGIITKFMYELFSHYMFNWKHLTSILKAHELIRYTPILTQ